jgi:hypothetical protein
MTEAKATDERNEDRRIEIGLESSTMVLYVSVVLLAALVAIDTSAEISDTEILGLIWGTTLGLALAHYFAFRVASQLVRGSRFHRRDAELALVQLGSAVAVAVVCTIPVVLMSRRSEYDVVRLELALLLGIAGYAAGRTGGASRPRSLATGAIVLVVGVAVALVKNVLIGH